jgi:hypothetical protein
MLQIITMGTSSEKRGRPRIPGAPDAAERMRASRERKRRAGLRLVQSWVASTPAAYSDHQRLDARSLAIHSLVARKLMADPGLVARARENLQRWKRNSPSPLPSYFAEWERIVRRPLAEVAGFLVTMSEEATRLRQSSPFSPLLTREERDRIYTAFK